MKSKKEETLKKGMKASERLTCCSLWVFHVEKEL